MITDGDDQQSYPLDAAAIAAERHVTIFTVGLGDADHGARIPQGAESKSYVEYQGQQVWSKLDNSLLKEIALKTAGVYVPVGTRAYDLGELYAKYLQGRRGADEASHKRIRRAEQYQIFLALALLALLVDIFTRPHPAATARSEEPGRDRAVPASRKGESRTKSPRPAIPVATALLLVACLSGTGRADTPAANVRDGLNWYSKGDFDKAREKFAAAREQLDSRDAAKAAIAAFDQACALHRKGDIAAAREWYLKAGLAHDKALAASAHFNLGTLSAQEAGRLAGEKPEEVAPDKRPEILDQLKAAVASFRHCLDLQPDHARARRDIELVRRWIKYYSDRWVARDREKRRQEMNLVAFLEFLIETQKALRESVKALPEEASSDAFAEPKRVQDELQEEIQPLKDKIKAELTPPPQAPASGASGNSNSSSAPQGIPPEVEQGITMLQGWAGVAGDKMASASHHLDERRGAPAATDQQAAIDELEKIWDAVIPFHALLARDLADQTGIARALAPEPDDDTKPPGEASPASEKEAAPKEASPGTENQTKKIGPPQASATAATASTKAASPPREAKEKGQDSQGSQPRAQDPVAAAGSHAVLASERQDLGPLTETQERTQRRTQLLKLKAEAELDRLAKSPPAEAESKPRTDDNEARKGQPKDGAADQPQPVDPKLIKAGYQKAVELAPRAVEQMGRAVKSLKHKSPDTAFPPAEEARKILEEIQKAQPKDPKKDQEKKDQQKKDQEKKDQQDQQKKDQEKKDQDQQKKDQEKKDQQDQEKKDQQKKDQEKQDQEKKDQEEKKKQDDQSQSGEQKKARKGEKPQVSQDQIEDALRKVRERQQEKRERDRRMKARILGRVPVEKDW